MEEIEKSGLVRQAKALRDKYSTGPKMQIVIDFLGPHPKNRGGQYPSHEAVLELCCKLIKEGFDVDEANHMGACVSELDSEQQGSAGSPKDDKTGKYQTYTAYSEEKCAAVAAYKGVFRPGQQVLFGTLSHTHLVMVLRSLKFKAAMKLPDHHAELAKWQDGEHGPWKTEALCEKDPALKQLLEQGLLMEVLKPEAYIDDPANCSRISQALNYQHEVASKTHDMTAVAVTADAVEKLRTPEGKVEFKDVQLAVCSQISRSGDDNFVDLVSFVVDLGARKGGHVDYFLDFARRFVNPNGRKLRWASFGQANLLGCKCPRAKVAALMRAYRKEPTRGYCPVPEANIFKHDESDLESWEELLYYFHWTCKDAVASVLGSNGFKLLVNVDIATAEAMAKAVKGRSPSDPKSAKRMMLTHTVKHWNMLKEEAGKKNVPLPPPRPEGRWISYDGVVEGPQAVKAASDKPTDKMEAGVIAFGADGRALGEQDKIEKKG